MRSEGEMSNKKKVAFLFGAGAETKGFNMPMGLQFYINTVIKHNEGHALKSKNALANYFSGKYYDDKVEYIKYGKIASEEKDIERILKHSLYLIALQNKKIYENYGEFIINNISEYNCEELMKKYGSIEYNSKHTIRSWETFLQSFKEIINTSKINCDDAKEIFEEMFNKDADTSAYYFNMKLSCGNLLDGKFHTFIDPSKYGNAKFCRLFNYYWRSYFYLVENIVEFIDEEKQIFADYYDRKSDLDYNKIIQNQKKFSALLYGEDCFTQIKRNKNNYYSAIKEEILDKGNVECSGVLTTNYYKFVELLGHKHKYAYLNGKLSMFEKPEKLEIIDFENKNYKNNILTSKELFLPYIMGQSFVKPIISPLQIEEYCKMNAILKEADKLVILGYGINSDDNHINSYLHSFISEQGKEIIIVSNNDNVKKEKINIAQKLKISDKTDKIKICKCKYSDVDIKGLMQSLNRMIKE